MPSRTPFTWTRLHLPTPLAPEIARAAVQALAGLSGHPRLVLETRGEAGRVAWFLGADAVATRQALAALKPHVAGLRTDDSPSVHHQSTTAAALRVGGHRENVLDSNHAEDATKALLGSLARAHDDEQVRLQLILGPHHRPRLPLNAPPEKRAGLKSKYAEHRFSCELRIGATAGDPARAGRLIQGVAEALRGLEAPGVAIRLRRASTSSIDGIRSPYLWPLELNVSEVAAVIGWPLAKGDAPLPGVPSPHPRLLAASDRVPTAGRMLGVSAIEHHRAIALGVEDSLRHLHILGPNGVGKSVLLASLALQDIAAGRGVVLLDAKGDTVTDVLARLDSARLDDVVVLDPTDSSPVGIDAFHGDPDRAADVLYGVFRSLYGEAIGPRSGDLLHASLLLLARSGNASLSTLPLLLTSPAFRRSLVAQVAVHDPLGLGSYWSWFEANSEGNRAQIVAPLKNKLDPLLSLRPGLRAVFGQRTPRFSLADIFTNRRILLVNLGSGALGPEAARLLGSVLVAMLWQTAQTRIHVPAERRHPVMLHVDEAQEVVRLGDVGDALARARGLGVGFTLAHQALTQLPTAVRDAVMANARNRIAFQLSPQDAKSIAGTTSGTLAAEDFQELPAFTAYVSLLSGGNRAPWCSLATQPLGAPIRDPEALKAQSRTTYGIPRADTEADLLQVAGIGPSAVDESFGRTPRGGRS